MQALQIAPGNFKRFFPSLYGGKPHDMCVRRIRQELRLAALLHDMGHSLFSHASEKVYSNLALLRRASSELTNIAGKEKGAGEVISFCLAQTSALRELIDRGRRKLMDSLNSDSWAEDVDFDHISLMIIGRAWHPYLQFLGDIVSSAFDADKLDYLLRDATAAGLPLRYDLDRVLTCRSSQALRNGGWRGQVARTLWCFRCRHGGAHAGIWQTKIRLLRGV